MRGGKLSRTFVATRSKEREMTTPSDIAHHAAQARARDLAQAAQAVRCAEPQSPRSTFSLNPWVARCVPAPPRPTPLHANS
jgi:hypothetical protein